MMALDMKLMHVPQSTQKQFQADLDEFYAFNKRSNIRSTLIVNPAYANLIHYGEEITCRIDTTLNIIFIFVQLNDWIIRCAGLENLR